MSNTILICGGTGRQGSAVANSLLKKNQNIKILTRDMSLKSNQDKLTHFQNLGVEIVQADMTNENSLKKALLGVTQVFLMTTPYEAGIDAEIQQGITMIRAAKNCNINHLVFSSVSNANKSTGIPHFESKWVIEKYLYNSKIPSTVIRPVAFMDDMVPPAILSAIQDGKLLLPLLPGKSFQTVAIRDIGDFVSSAFTQKSYIGQQIDIAGDELTPIEYTRLISQHINKPLEYAQLPDEQFNSVFGDDLSTMFRWFNQQGYTVDINELKIQWGIPLTSFKQLTNSA